MLLLTTAALPQLERHRHPNLGRLITPRHYARLHDTLAAGFPVAVDNDCFQGLDPAAVCRMLGVVPCEEWILEPCVGGGVMLIAALDAYRHLHGPDAARAITLIGVDIDRRSCQIARASLLLAGANPDQFWIFAGNSLAQPIVGRDRRDGALREITFSAILTNPPFGTKTSAAELGAHAARGPLVIPDHVLYRRLPAIGDRQRPHEPAPAVRPAVPERVGAPFEQLRPEWVA